MRVQAVGFLGDLVGVLGGRRPILGVVLGADCCRCVVVRREARLATEPAAIVHASTADLTRSAELPARSSVEAFADLLVHMRRLAGSALRSRRRPDLAVTGRPELLAALGPHLREAARRAGFHSCVTVDECTCIAAAARVPDGGALIVDVGHVGTRLWRCGTEGRPPQPVGEIESGGAAMVSAVVRSVRTAHGLLIGSRTAAALLAALNSEEEWPLQLKGKDLLSGLPRAVTLTRREAFAPVEPVLRGIVDACVGAAPAQDAGGRAVLAGGAADSEDLLLMLASSLAGPVELRPSPGDLSAEGLAMLLSSGAVRPTPAGHTARGRWYLALALVAAMTAALWLGQRAATPGSALLPAPADWRAQLAALPPAEYRSVTDHMSAITGEVTALLVTESDVWVGTMEDGLFRYERTPGRWISFEDSPIGERIERIWQEGGRIWVEHGIWGNHTYCYVDYTADRGGAWTRFLVGDATGDYVHSPRFTNAGLRTERLRAITDALRSGVYPEELVDHERIGDEVFFTIYVNSADGWCAMFRYDISTDTLTDLAMAEQKEGGVGVRDFYMDPYDARYVWILSGDYGGAVQMPRCWFRYDRSSGDLQDTGMRYEGIDSYIDFAAPDRPYLDLIRFGPSSVEFLGRRSDGTFGPIGRFLRKGDEYRPARRPGEAIRSGSPS